MEYLKAFVTALVFVCPRFRGAHPNPPVRAKASRGVSRQCQIVTEDENPRTCRFGHCVSQSWVGIV